MSSVKIIFDCSGSMAEYGRKDVLKNVFSAVRQNYSSVEIFRWNDTIEPINKVKDIVTQGRINSGALTEFFKNLDKDCNVLLVSDGCWSKQDTDNICSVTKENKIYACALGQDANLAVLGKVQTKGKKVFKMSDFPMALQLLMKG